MGGFIIGAMNIQYELNAIKSGYRDIFMAEEKTIREGLLKLRSQFNCPHCQPLSNDASMEMMLSFCDEHCGYLPWVVHAVSFLESVVGKKILDDLSDIEAERDSQTCHQCGVCCRFASSEFSFDALLEKAKNGDMFAEQFTSIFLPYASTEVARQKFPDIVDAILHEVRTQTMEADTNECDTAPVYFYHCPYVGEDNRCTIYGTPKRPEICSQYPSTPLTFIYEKCAWKPWKDKRHTESMAVHARIEIASFYASKLRAITT